MRISKGIKKARFTIRPMERKRKGEIKGKSESEREGGRDDLFYKTFDRCLMLFCEILQNGRQILPDSRSGLQRTSN